ncbi:MAG: thioesterase [Holophagaceae bacterium]|nr:thioesterase [Holophagaceae bacterium]
MAPITPAVIGAEGEASVVVTPEVTVRHFHPHMPEVYGTPFMIYLMEVAAGQAIQASLPAGWVSVGVEVNIRHLAPTPVGRTVTARARVTAVGDKLIAFDVEAHDGVNLIGKGTHSRAPIELARFEQSLLAR